MEALTVVSVAGLTTRRHSQKRLTPRTTTFGCFARRTAKAELGHGNVRLIRPDDTLLIFGGRPVDMTTNAS